MRSKPEEDGSELDTEEGRDWQVTKAKGTRPERQNAHREAPQKPTCLAQQTQFAHPSASDDEAAPEQLAIADVALLKPANALSPNQLRKQRQAKHGEKVRAEDAALEKAIQPAHIERAELAVKEANQQHAAPALTAGTAFNELIEERDAERPEPKPGSPTQEPAATKSDGLREIRRGVLAEEKGRLKRAGMSPEDIDMHMMDLDLEIGNLSPSLDMASADRLAQLSKKKGAIPMGRLHGL